MTVIVIIVMVLMITHRLKGHNGQAGVKFTLVNFAVSMPAWFAKDD